MEYLSKIAQKIYADLRKNHQKVESYKKVREYSAYGLGLCSLVVMGSAYLSNSIAIIFDNFLVTLFLYGSIISAVGLAAANIYSKDPKEKSEALRQKLIKKLEDEKDICSSCQGKCIHKERFIQEVEENDGINLYY